MNFTPRQVDEMTLWELIACSDGVARANGHDDVEPPSNAEFDEMLARYDERTATQQ